MQVFKLLRLFMKKLVFRKIFFKVSQLMKLFGQISIIFQVLLLNQL